MFIEKLVFRNYKSLHRVEVKDLAPLTCFVGPNAAGKSNLADALDFLREVLTHGLELALQKKGGYGNVVYRQSRRASSPVSLMIDFPYATKDNPAGSRIEYGFSFQSKNGGIDSPVIVMYEEFRVYSEEADSFHVVREKNFPKLIAGDLTDLPDYSERVTNTLMNAECKPQELFINRLVPQFISCRMLADTIGIYAFSIDKLREGAFPLYEPFLGMSGENLPLVVRNMQKNGKNRIWQKVITAMRQVLPELEKIDTYVNSAKQVELHFYETGNSTPWRACDLSDGTLRTLALLVAMFDPGTSCLMIEELENAVHPWVLRELVTAAREAAKTKSIFLTTHSPTLIDLLYPEEIQVVSRRGGKTDVKALTRLDKNVARLWREGKVTLSSTLDSGLIPRSVPGAAE